MTGIDISNPEDSIHRRIPAWGWNLLVACAVLATSLVPSDQPHQETVSPPVVLSDPRLFILPITAIAFLMFRHRRPYLSLCGTLLIFACGVVLTGYGTAFFVPVIIASYAVAAQLNTLKSVAVSCTTVVLIAGIEILNNGISIVNPHLLPPVAMIIASTALADASRSRRAYVAAIMERAERAERTREAEAQRRVAEERLRIARDLHDAVAHQIAVINLHSGVAKATLSAEQGPDLSTVRNSLDVISEASQSALSEIGDLLHMLRAESQPGERQAPLAPLQTLSSLDELVASFATPKRPVSIRVEGEDAGLPEAVDRVAYQVIRECLTNAYKYGTGSTHVLLTHTPKRFGIIISNEINAVAEGNKPSSGLGIIGMRERVASVRGSLQTGHRGNIFRVEMQFPIDNEHHSKERQCRKY
ncbi:sensor histidine kinase [Bifidobacterium psychraerophilum]|uniref:sensor histidine kinase n=1 Tax=Bifidobacterium psychraerophilum TaxID=218140 RepID=UPI0039E96652